MITRNDRSAIYGNRFVGLSTDEKPTENVSINSLFLELDTGDFYYLKQQGSESTETVTLVQETEINDYGEGWDQVRNTKYFDNQKVTVVWDGVTYECPRFDGGGQYYDGYGDPSFTEYPFYLYFQLDAGDNSILDVRFARGQASHNVEVYTEETVVVPTVWEKIGGSGSPSGELLVEINIDEWFDNTPPNSIYYEYITDVDLPDSITVDWNGASYQCTNGSTEESYKWYGAPWDDTIGGYDFEEYPFHLSYSVDSESDNIVYYIYAESSDTPVTVKIYG